MQFNFRNKVAFHSLSLIAIVALLITKTVNQWILILAIGLIGANIYNLISLMINSEDEKFKYNVKELPKREKQGSCPGKFDVGRFQEKVRSAFQRNFNKNSNYIQQENKYWNSSYFSRSEKAQELKTIKISDLSKQRRPKFEDYESCFRQEGLSIKKIRNFLQNKEKQDDNNVKSLKELVNQQFAKVDPYKNLKNISQSDIKQVLITIQTYINNKISNNYDKIASDFNQVNKFLQKCFSLTLSLSQSVSSTSINYIQLMQAVSLIEKRQIIPHAFTSNMTPLQVKKELAAIRKNLDSLPNLCLPANVLKLSIFVQCLQQQFKGQNIMFSKFQREQRIEGKCHLFKCQENGRVYYNKQSKIKSRCSATPILVFLVCNLDQFSKSNKPIVRELNSVFSL